MSDLHAIPMGRDLDGADESKILNIAQLTLTSAAFAANEPIRKGEHDTALQSINSDATVFTDFGLVEDELQSLDTRMDTVEATNATQSVTLPFNGAFVDNGDGTHTATIAHTFNSTALNFQIQKDNGDGSWHYLSQLELDMEVTSSAFVFTTNSEVVAAYSVRVIASGVVVA